MNRYFARDESSIFSEYARKLRHLRRRSGKAYPLSDSKPSVIQTTESLRGSQLKQIEIQVSEDSLRNVLPLIYTAMPEEGEAEFRMRVLWYLFKHGLFAESITISNTGSVENWSLAHVNH